MILSVLACGTAGIGQSPVPLTKERVLFLLPLGVDNNDPVIVARYKELLAYGEASHPILAQIASETDDGLTLGVVLSMLELSGSKGPIARTIAKDVLKRFENLPGPNAQAVRQRAVRTFGIIGTKQDIPLLLPLLESEEEFLRTNAARTLGKLGDESTAAQIKEILQKVSERPGLRPLEKERLLEEGQKATKQIKDRLDAARPGNGGKTK